MHLAKYTLLAAALAGSSVVVASSNRVEGKTVGTDNIKQLKMPGIWKSPLFKAAPPSLGPPSPPGPPGPPFPPSPPAPAAAAPSGTSSPSGLQENFQISGPAPILTAPLHACSVTLVDRSFGNSYGSPSHVTYDPSAAFAGTQCADPRAWTGLTLDVHGETRGRQFDRLGTVWIGNNATGQGVEVLRLDNPEPTRSGVYWNTSKDVGKYFPLFSTPGDVVFDLPNIVDSTYTGALNVTLTLTASVDGFIPQRGAHRRRAPSGSHVDALPLAKRAADVVLPLSKRLAESNSVFLLGGTAGNGSTPVRIPHNAARALVEVYVSGTASEEFWYTGIPDRFFNAIPNAAAEGYYGKGPYREVQLYIDGAFAGFVTPYPVIFTGGINPLLWRPSANYGTFDQPTYTIDVTPFLGTLTDGVAHTFELAVVSSERDGAINDGSWFVSGNVQVYLDSSDERTTGELVKVEGGAERVDGYVAGKLVGNPLENGTLMYEVGLKQPRSFGVAGRIKTGSGIEYVAGWYQSAEYSNKGFVNATTQTNDQKSWGWARSLVLNQDGAELANVTFDELLTAGGKGGVQAVQLDYNYPLYVGSSLTDTAFDANVNQQFDRTVRRTTPSSPPRPNADLMRMVGDESTFVHAQPIAALPHTTLSKRSEAATSVLLNGAIANGTGTSQQSFMYRDMAGATIDRQTRTNTTSVLEDRLAGSAASRAQPPQLVVV